MNHSAYDLETLQKVCLDGVCHCDWRLTIEGCAETHAMTIVYGIHAALCAMNFIIGSGLLFNRVVLKGHTLFDASASKGCFRPKPIDCMLLFLIIFNILRFIVSMVLLTDICPDMISRSFLFEFPWQFEYGGFAVYLIGIAQTLADSHRAIANSWLPSPRLVDIIGGTLFTAPFIINNVFSLSAGILAERDLRLAQLFSRLIYIMWFVYCTTLAALVAFAGVRLVAILQEHLQKFNTSGPRYVAIQTGIFKIRAVVSIISIAVMMFAIFLLIFGILREIIIINYVGSIVLSIIWNFLGAVSSGGVIIAILINPKIDDNTNLGLKTSSAERSNSQQTPQFVTYSNFSAQEYSATASNHNQNGAHGTLSHNAFDELKLQQLQYQKVFQKHNQLPHSTIDKKIVPEMKISPSGIPLQDSEYFNSSEEKASFRGDRHQSHQVDDDHIEDDGENSQMDLVEYAAKN
ncbi:uncharacterized protein B0P05DRAFT_100803 [Gilbertella persicaria]|uniref:Uncharacterized protein n=1 Tax=Rhizopus stolonifer TaxID=4846 RepID=A0A367IT43_RHIST|nr:uncharacterized protein B0P05DRAFT_100803 [Gilbertella persicaria]KAI8098042.1 hypothetical protein B0P05DRAFT_100803 [Gilbertella persicaria]RCH80865.1 hypothetical protein CU098_004325 [Rhizopus stolonifer]